MGKTQGASVASEVNAAKSQSGAGLEKKPEDEFTQKVLEIQNLIQQQKEIEQRERAKSNGVQPSQSGKIAVAAATPR